MTPTERHIITIIFAILDGAVWALVALLLGASIGVVCAWGVVTGVVCWVGMRVFHVVGLNA